MGDATIEDALESAVARLRTGLEADGYRLVVSSDTTCPVVDVIAGPEACAECLVPKQLMLDLLTSLLPAGSATPRLRYPDETSSTHG